MHLQLTAMYTEELGKAALLILRINLRGGGRKEILPLPKKSFPFSSSPPNHIQTYPTNIVVETSTFQIYGCSGLGGGGEKSRASEVNSLEEGLEIKQTSSPRAKDVPSPGTCLLKQMKARHFNAGGGAAEQHCLHPPTCPPAPPGPARHNPFPTGERNARTNPKERRQAGRRAGGQAG